MLFFGMLLISLQKVFSRTLCGHSRPLHVLRAVPMVVALTVVYQVVRAFI